MKCDYCDNEIKADIRDNCNKRVCWIHSHTNIIRYKLSAYLMLLAQKINPCKISISVHFE